MKRAKKKAARRPAPKPADTPYSAMRRAVAVTLECGHEYTLGRDGLVKGLVNCAACGVRAPPSPGERRMKAVEALLKPSLQVAVSLWAKRMEEQGWTLPKLQEEAARCGELVAHQGDALMFRTKAGKDEKTSAGTAAVFNALARGLAALSFCPGGVNAFGLHWESDPAKLGAQAEAKP